MELVVAETVKLPPRYVGVGAEPKVMVGVPGLMVKVRVPLALSEVVPCLTARTVKVKAPPGVAAVV